MEQMYFPGEQDTDVNIDESTDSDSSKDDEELKDGGEVYSSGYGYFGQLGDGSGENFAIPRQVKGLKNIISVSTGEAHSVALSATGEVYGWGCNRYGQLGLGDSLNRVSPTLVEALKGIKIKQLACGTQHTVFLARNGEVYTVGCGSFGRLGHGDHKHQVLPRPVSAMRGKLVTQISAGGWFSGCVSDQGAVYTWGCNRYGQLGHGKIAIQLFPRHVTTLYGKTVAKLVCGKHHILVYTDQGECLSFGAGMCGQLGNKNKKHSFTPVPVELPKEPLLDIASGNLHSVALSSSGQIYIWGYISDDHLGLSESGEEYQAVPIQVTPSAKAKFVKLFAGGWHSAAISDEGTLFTWGFAYKGRLGYGDVEEDTKHPLAPMPVESFKGRSVQTVSCGGSHTLYVVSERKQQ